MSNVAPALEIVPFQARTNMFQISGFPKQPYTQYQGVSSIDRVADLRRLISYFTFDPKSVRVGLIHICHTTDDIPFVTRHRPCCPE